jgi:DNA-directed RNA polymerase specialized sigma24 family protein
VSTKNKNEAQKKNQESQECQEGACQEKAGPRTRTRSVDFMSIEDTMGDHPLTAFELKVKEKIASVPSPFDELTRKEDEEEKTGEVQARLAGLIEKARFTPAQKTCFELAYREGFSNQMIADRLGIAIRNVRRLKRSIIRALKQVYECQRVKTQADACQMTRKQRLAAALRYGERLSEKEIAQRLGISVRGVINLLSRVRKKLILKNISRNV